MVDVVFENVSFHYSRRDPDKSNGANGVSGEDVLHGISFSGRAGGQQMALLGATGAGKSTLVNLIPRFYDVSGGSGIASMAVDVRDWEPAGTAGADWHGAAGIDALQWQRPRQYRIWRARGDA